MIILQFEFKIVEEEKKVRKKDFTHPRTFVY